MSMEQGYAIFPQNLNNCSHPSHFEVALIYFIIEKDFCIEKNEVHKTGIKTNKLIIYKFYNTMSSCNGEYLECGTFSYSTLFPSILS
jgi:hypothetical protein